MAELKDHQQEEMESKLQFHLCLTLREHMLASFKVHNSKSHMQETYCLWREKSKTAVGS